MSGALVIRWQAEEQGNKTNVTLKGSASHSAIRKHKRKLSTDPWLLEEWSLGDLQWRRSQVEIRLMLIGVDLVELRVITWRGKVPGCLWISLGSSPVVPQEQ